MAALRMYEMRSHARLFTQQPLPSATRLPKNDRRIRFQYTRPSMGPMARFPGLACVGGRSRVGSHAHGAAEPSADQTRDASSVMPRALSKAALMLVVLFGAVSPFINCSLPRAAANTSVAGLQLLPARGCFAKPVPTTGVDVSELDKQAPRSASHTRRTKVAVDADGGEPARESAAPTP
jgi:hypothetical protein